MSLLSFVLFGVGTVLIFALPVIVTIGIVGLVAWLINTKAGKIND